MPELTLDEENLLARAGIADRDFADHSGAIQHGYELGSLTRGLVAYYPMEEGQGQVLHDGALDNPGQLNGPSWTSGNIGSSALSFNGSTDYVRAENTSAITQVFGGEDGGCVSIWAYQDSSTTDGRTLLYKDIDNEGFNLRVYNSDYILFGLRYSGTAASWETSTGIWPTGQWNHVLVSFKGKDASTEGRSPNIYVNGSKQSLTTTNSPGDTLDSGVEPLDIGRNSNNAQYWNGDLNEVRIYDRRLSQPEIEALYNLGQPSGHLVEERDVPTYPEPAALARYEFEGDVNDSWNGFDGTDNTDLGYVDGVYGQAKAFDGTGDSVNVGEPVISDKTDEFAVSVWYNTNDRSSNKYVVSEWNSVDAGGTSCWVMNINSGRINWNVTQENGTNLRTSTPDANEWVHGVGVAGNGSVRLYINGQLVDYNASWDGTLNTSENFVIGDQAGGGNSFDGEVDDVRLYTRGLSSVEVETLFNKGAYRINRGEL